MDDLVDENKYYKNFLNKKEDELSTVKKELISKNKEPKSFKSDKYGLIGQRNSYNDFSPSRTPTAGLRSRDFKWNNNELLTVDQNHDVSQNSIA